MTVVEPRLPNFAMRNGSLVVRPRGAPSMRVIQELSSESVILDADEARIIDRWSHLNGPIPLEGAAAMAETADGGVLIASQLAARVPWMERLAEIVEAECRLSLAVGQPWLHLPPLLLVGPPGAGKSFWAGLLAGLADCGVGELDLAGRSDNRLLEGTSRGWSQAMPCWPLVVMGRTDCANPVLIIDEIDKAGGGPRNGDPLQTLLAMLEPSTAARYHDGCLLATADLSQCTWLLTSNTVSGLPKPLLSRVRVVEVAGPEAYHADAVIDAVLSDLARSWHLTPNMLPALPASTRRVMRDSLAATGSVRLLVRQVRTALAALLQYRGGRPLS